MGCLRTWVARLIWVLTALIIGMIFWGSFRYPEAMWAPGHLSRVHADATDCHGCHEPFRGVRSRKCLMCHTSHRFQAHADPATSRRHLQIIRQSESCLSCHTEHQGDRTRFTSLEPRNPHGELVFQMTGARDCLDCHRANSVKKTMTSALLNNPLVQYLQKEGLGAHQPGHFAECFTCHFPPGTTQ